MVRQPVLMIVGKAGSGKSTLADLVSKETGATVISLADPLKRIARQIFPQLTVEQLWGPSEKREAILDKQAPALSVAGTAGAVMHELRLSDDYRAAVVSGAEEWFESLQSRVVTPRLILQTLGTEFVRKVNKDAWIAACDRAVGTVTYPPMVTYRKETGIGYLPSGETVSAVVPDGRFVNEAQAARDLGWFVARISRPGAAGEAYTHASETEQDNIPVNVIDFEVDNSFGLSLLEVEARTICTSIEIFLKNQKRRALRR